MATRIFMRKFPEIARLSTFNPQASTAFSTGEGGVTHSFAHMAISQCHTLLGSFSP